jgi:hypothetical protein
VTAATTPLAQSERGENDVERSEWNDGNAAGGVLDRRIRIGIPMKTPSHSPVPNQQAAQSI